MRDLIPKWAHHLFELQHVNLYGIDVPYLVGGSGEPVVLLHGLTGSLDWWQYNAPAFAEHSRVYLIDLPGFGWLGKLTVCDSVREYVDWVRNWTRTLGLAHASLIGHSMGGHISMRLAAESPEVVRKLALLPLAISHIRRANPRTVWRSSHDLIEQHVLDNLGDVRAPRLIVWGDEDPILPFAYARQFQDAIEGAELLVVPGAGHIPMVDEPETFNTRVMSFLAGNQS
jgi:pimeloyl-ACP methyl ester carboxylesterase